MTFKTALSAVALTVLLASCSHRTPVAATVAVAPSPEPEHRQVDVESEDEPAAALKFFVAQRAPDGVNIPVERLAAAKDHVKRMARTTIGRGRSTSVATSSGGAPSPGAWTSVGPANVGGLTRAFAVNPQTPNIMYAGASGGGVWMTSDGGKTWTATTDFLITDSVQSLAIDPQNPNTLYAGTGDNIGGEVGIRGRGIFKSTDGGQSWTLLPGTATNPDFYYNYTIVVSPKNSNTIYVGTVTGVWMSPDGGISWTQSLARVAPNTGCEELAIRTDQSTDYLFAACGRFNAPASAVFRNVDAAGSGTWENILSVPGMGRTSLAIAPSQPNRIYALLTDARPSSDFYQGSLGVYRSDSSGDAGSWQAMTTQSDSNRVNLTLLSNPRSAFADVCSGGTAAYGGQGSHDNVLAVDPLNPDRVWAGGVDIFRSDDGGANWGIAMFWETAAPTGAHADNHRLVFHPNYDGGANQTLYNTSDGGVYMTANANADVSTGDRAACSPHPTKVAWKNLNSGYSVTQFYDGVVLPGANQYIAGAQDNGTLYGADGFGSSWVLVRSGDGGAVMVNPQDPNVFYTNYVYLSLARSVDGGNSQTLITAGITEPNSSTNFLFIAPVAMDPRTPDRIYIGGKSLWRSDDRGDDWQQVSTLTNSLQGHISAISISPVNSSVVMYGTDGGYIFSSNTALTSDSTVTWNAAQPRSSGFVARIAFDPTDVNTAYAVYRTYAGSGQHYVYKTSDGGLTWTALAGSGATALPDAPVHSIVVDPQNNQALYVGTELGVFTSPDGGNTWLADTNDFANTPVTQLALDRGTGVTNLVAFTYGRGVWKTTIPGSGSPCTYAFAAKASLPANNAAATIPIQTGDGCVWSLTPLASYLYAKSPAVGTGSGTATMYGSWNFASQARTALMVVADKTVQVTQQGATPLAGNDDVAAVILSIPYLGSIDSRKDSTNAADPVHSCTNSQDFKTAWWSFVAPVDGIAEIGSQGHRYDVGGNSGVVLTVYDGTNRAASSEMACATRPRDTSAWGPATVQVPVVAGKTYQIEVSATGDSAVDGGQTFVSVLMR